MYQADTFWHLDLLGRAGLVVSSSAMAAVTLWAVWKLTHRQRVPARLLAGLGAFVLFDWLAPQVHYLWYMVVIDGLPLQWVIGAPRPLAAWAVISLSVPDSLSAHARATLGWACISLALVRPWMARKPD